MMKRKSLLFITPRLPASADSGGLQVTLERLEILSRHFEVTVLAMEGSPKAEDQLLSRFTLQSIHHAGRLRKRSALSWLASIASGSPLSVWRNKPPAFMAKTDTLVAERFDVLYVDHWLMWPAASRFKKAGIRVLHLHNAEHLLFSRTAEQAATPVRWALHFEAWRVKRYLRTICSVADQVHYLSHADEAEMARLGVANAMPLVFLPSVEVERDTYGRHGNDILFVGTMSWAPNAEGIRWYLDHIATRLPHSCQTHIIGGYLEDIHPLIDGSSVYWHGRVPDLKPFYDKATVFIAPLLSGSGIKIKVLNALGHGIPVVTTSVGIEGFPPGWEDAIAVADAPESFAHAVERLCSDKASWERAAAATKPYLSRHFSSFAFSKWSQQTAQVAAKL